MALAESGAAAALVPPTYTNAGVPGIPDKMPLCPVCGTPMDRVKASANGTPGTWKCPKCGEVVAGSPGVDWVVDFDIKSVTEDEKGTLVLVGYGSTWVEDRDGETVAKDAFTDSLPTYMTNPVLLLNHQKDKVLGNVTGAIPDAIGVKVVAEVPKPPADSEPWHIKAYHDIRRGTIKAFSMGGVFYRSKTIQGLIWRVDLYEFSVVTIPANPTSLFAVATIKGIEGFEAKTAATGVGRGHGRHHRGPVGHAGPRTRHRHKNGVSHRHRIPRGGYGRHLHKDVDGIDVKSLDEELLEGSMVEDETDEGEIDQIVMDDDIDLVDDVAGVDVLDTKEAWTGSYKNDLPDSAFAYIESGGSKDSGGKTVPRSLRHFPHHNADGTLDLPHLRNALARAPQSPFGSKAMPHLEAHARSAGVGEHSANLTHTKEVAMGEEVETKETKGGTGAGAETVTIDKKSWDDNQAAMRVLLEEKQARDRDAEVARIASERLAAEQKDAKDKADQKAARDKEINDLVEQKMQALRAGMSTGTKFNYGAGAEAGNAANAGTANKQASIAEFCIKLVRSRKGDAKAFEWLVQEDAKAAATYGMKAYGETTSVAGGFLVPPAYLQTGIAEFRLAQSKVRQLVTVIRGLNTNSVLIPRETGISTVGWTAENSAKPATDATYAQITVGIYTLAGIAKVSNQLLEDSTPAVDQVVRRALGKSLGQQEDLAFISGTGVGMPTGILGTANVLTAAVGTKLWSSIAAAITSIQSNYFGNPTAILAHPRDVNTLRTTVDSQGRPIFLPNFWQGGGPAQGGPVSFMNPGAANPLEQTYQASPPDGYVFGLPIYGDANLPTNLGGGTETRMIIAAWDEAWILERDAVGLDVSNEAGTSWEQNQTWFRIEARLGFTAARQPSAFFVMTGLTPGAGL